MTGDWLTAVPAGFACLAVETSTDISSIAACAGGRTARAEYASPGRQSRDVYAVVRDVLQRADVKLRDLDCIALGCGPGGFTGLRVGAAVAQALGFGAGLPVCRVSSLAALAAGAMQRHAVDCVAACVDARMGEAYVGVYRRGDGTLLTEMDDRLVAPDRFRVPHDPAVFAAGPGWSAFPELAAANAGAVCGTDPDVIPGADALLTLAAVDFRGGRAVPPHAAVPNYVRDRVTS